MKKKPGHFLNKLKKSLKENKQSLNEQQWTCGDSNALNYEPGTPVSQITGCTYDDSVIVHIFHFFQPSNLDSMDSGEPNTGPNNYVNYVEGAFFQYGNEGSVWNQNFYEEIGSPPPGTWISNAVPGQGASQGSCFGYIGAFSINDTSMGGWAGTPQSPDWGTPVYSTFNLIGQGMTANLLNNPQNYFWTNSIEGCWNEAYEEVLGCTDPNANNYDPYANTDDDSCILPLDGCTDPTADNYNPDATDDDGSCIISGCTDPEAFNYDETANTDDGSCIDVVLGCTDPEAFNYNPEANTDDGSCIEVIEGCTDPEAFNYDETANTDDGSCIEIVTGCTNPEAFNYNPEANTDDGSCIDVIEGCTDSEAFNYNLEANTDDGSCYYNPGCTDSEAYNYDETSDFDDGSCEYAGCTVSWAVNYNPNVTIDDGSCEYNCSCTCGDLNGDGVMDEADYDIQENYILGNISFDEIPCPQNIITTNQGPNLAGSLVAFQWIMSNNVSDQAMMELDLCYNNQTFGEMNPGGGPPEFLDTIIMSEWLPEFYSAIETSGCYDLNVYGDDNEDNDIDDVDIDGDGDLDDVDVDIDGDDNLDDTEPNIEGCIDSNASNYNSEANIDDGSCVYDGCAPLEEYDTIGWGGFQQGDDASLQFLYPGVSLTFADYLCHVYYAQVVNGNTIDYNLTSIANGGTYNPDTQSYTDGLGEGFCCDQIGFVYNPESTAQAMITNKQPLPAKTTSSDKKLEPKNNIFNKRSTIYKKPNPLNEEIIKRLQKLANIKNKQ
tara:strand:- start:5527 stop:7845 length:2319 start_codon:yes stop_codon:yes gene_type:complete